MAHVEPALPFDHFSGKLANTKFLGTTSDKFYSTLRGFIIASLSAQLKSTE